MFPALDLVRLSYCFLCLRRMDPGAEEDRVASEAAVREVQVHLSRHLPCLDLSALSCFAVALRGRNMQDSRTRETSLTWGLAMAPAMDRLRRLLSRAETPEDLRRVAVCINAASRIASDGLMEAFARKVSERCGVGGEGGCDLAKPWHTKDTS